MRNRHLGLVLFVAMVSSIPGCSKKGDSGVQEITTGQYANLVAKKAPFDVKLDATPGQSSAEVCKAVKAKYRRNLPSFVYCWFPNGKPAASCMPSSVVRGPKGKPLSSNDEPIEINNDVDFKIAIRGQVQDFLSKCYSLYDKAKGAKAGSRVLAKNGAPTAFKDTCINGPNTMCDKNVFKLVNLDPGKNTTKGSNTGTSLDFEPENSDESAQGYDKNGYRINGWSRFGEEPLVEILEVRDETDGAMDADPDESETVSPEGLPTNIFSESDESL